MYVSACGEGGVRVASDVSECGVGRGEGEGVSVG